MEPLPHHYLVRAFGEDTGDIVLSARSLPTLASAAPAEFDGPGTRWSPETLLVAAVGDCLQLTFRAVARASRVAFVSLHCEVTGTLARVDQVARFTAFEIRARLAIPPGTDPEQARRALERAEQRCVISNSLTATVNLNIEIEVATLAPA
jgi:uncharacterized OsmC-like protein